MKVKLRCLSPGTWESASREWLFQRREHSRTWHVYRRDPETGQWDEEPETFTRFSTLREAVRWAMAR